MIICSSFSITGGWFSSRVPFYAPVHTSCPCSTKCWPYEVSQNTSRRKWILRAYNKWQSISCSTAVDWGHPYIEWMHITFVMIYWYMLFIYYQPPLRHRPQCRRHCCHPFKWSNLWQRLSEGADVIASAFNRTTDQLYIISDTAKPLVWDRIWAELF